jgi:hypothetical protein
MPSKLAFTVAAVASALLATVLTTALAASSAVTTPNIVRNGGAELGPAAPDDSHVVVPRGWTTRGMFTAATYGPSGLPDATVSAAIHGGHHFFAGGPANAFSTASQMITVPSSWLGQVHLGHVSARLSADLGGWDSQTDNATVAATFLDATGVKVGVLRIGPVTESVRGGKTELLARHTTGAVPAQTRSVQIVIAAKRYDGSYNDGYVDNVSLSLQR